MASLMGRSWSDHTTVQLNARPHRSGGGQQRRRQQQQQQQKRRSVPLIGDDQAQKSRTSQLMMGRFANQAIIKLTRSSARASGGRCVIAVRESHPPLRGKKKLKPKELYSASLFLCLCVCVFRLFSRAPLSRLTRKLITTNRRPTTKKQSKPSKTQPAKKSSANRRGGRWVRKRNEEKVLFFPCYELRNNTSLWPTSIVGAQDTIGRNRNQIVCQKKKEKKPHTKMSRAIGWWVAGCLRFVIRLRAEHHKRTRQNTNAHGKILLNPPHPSDPSRSLD